MTFLASLASDEGEWRGLAEELAPSLRVSPVEVERRIRNAVDLARRMPRVLDAMREGQVELYGARRILAVTSPLSDEHAREVDGLLADKLASAPLTSWQPRNLAQHAARLVEKVDPGGQAERARMARAGRRVELEHGPNAQSRLTADLLLGNDPGVRVPEAAATVYLHMPIDAALSISDSGCELDGYGPLPAAVAREIMTNRDSTWRKVLCDPATGQPMDLGRTRRRPNAAIRELVRVRDRECVVPWCRRPARHCDLDHQKEWATDNGPTSATNTAPRCRRHHRMKNAPGWITRYDPHHGTSSITTPHGSTYTGKRRPILTPTQPLPDDPPF